MAVAIQVGGELPPIGGIGTREMRFTGTLTFAALATALTLDFKFSENADDKDRPTHLLGDFWLYIEQTHAQPVAGDDVDIQIQPIAIDAAGDVSVTQQVAVDIQNAADFTTTYSLHGFSLNEWFAVNGDKDMFIGGHGVRLTLDPAAECTAVFDVILIVR